MNKVGRSSLIMEKTFENSDLEMYKNSGKLNLIPTVSQIDGL